ncbi:MAG: GHKL domain-containing protein, partial [Oscillospiraceae bacterium]
MKRMLFDILTGLPAQLLMCYCVCHLVTIRKKICYTALSVVLLAANYWVTLYLLHDLTLVRLLMSVLINLVCTRVFSQESLPRVALATGLMYLVSCASEVLVLLCYVAMHGASHWQPIYAAPGQLLLMRGLCLLIYALLFYPVLALYRKRTGMGRELFLIFPLSQGLLLYCFYAFAFPQRPGIAMGLLLLALAAVCLLADFALYRVIRAMEQSYALEQQNAQLESRLKEQLSYYSGLQESMSRVNQMRHDIGNHLQTAYALLKQGNTTVVQEQLDQLSQQLGELAGGQLCQNQIGDAVLREKQRICVQRGISLTVEADIPSGLSMRGIDLCSLLANMLDNAITGCGGTETPDIALHAACKGGFLIVKVSNPALPSRTQVKEPCADGLPEHGVGLSILRSIAA